MSFGQQQAPAYQPQPYEQPAPAAAPAPAPQQEQRPSAFAEVGNDLVWHGGDGLPADYGRDEQAPQRDDQQPDNLGDGLDPELLDALFPSNPMQSQQGRPPAQQNPYAALAQPTVPNSLQLPPREQMPESYDPDLLDPGKVTLKEQQLQMHFQQQMMMTQDDGYRQALQQAYQFGVAALRQKAEASRMAVMAYNLYQNGQQIGQQLEPARRIQAARALAQRFGISDHRQLLKHPRTGQPVTNPEVMLTIASMLGEEQRQARINQRSGVDAPLTPTQGASGRRGIASIDPHSKEFEDIERMVASGRHVRLVG